MHNKESLINDMLMIIWHSWLYKTASVLTCNRNYQIYYKDLSMEKKEWSDNLTAAVEGSESGIS